ncbi:MAG TPA: DUF4292 domain-containing protein, partial [Bacteroidia bacterium]|nr:DUF4292 domain-containing protein [Bacteroidia bacterium]
WFSARLACEASSDSAHVGFDVILRMRRDSMIWMLVTDPLMGIKVARVLITKDSVKFVQYGLLGAPDRCFSGDFAYLSLLLQTDVDFEMMQSLLIGNSAEFYEEDEKLKSSLNRASCTYTLGTIRKRRLRKIIGGQRQVEDPVQTITLDPSSFKILNILFLDAQNRTFTATYSNFKTLDSMLVPAHAVFYARGLHKNATLDASYKHISLSGPLEFPFVFPDDCETILIPQRGENNKQPAPGH